MKNFAETMQEKLKWRMQYLSPSEVNAEKPADPEKSLARFGCRNASGHVCLRMPEDRGKVSDCGFDQFVCWYAPVPADFDADISAEITVDSFISGGFPTFQEGFGVFIRDTMDQDPKTGLYYSNMAAAGGLLGRINILVREGVHEGRTDRVQSRWFDESRVPSDVFSSGRPLKLTVRLSIDGNTVKAGVFNGDGTSALDARRASGSFCLGDDGLAVTQMNGSCFRERSSGEYYVGFMAARGAGIRVDKDSIRIDLKRTERGTPAPVYAAADGSACGNGSKDSPLDLETALSGCVPGQEIILLPGTYCFAGRGIRIGRELSGEPASRCRLTGTTEGGKGVIIDLCGTESPFMLEADYWDVSGIAVTGGFGMQISGSCNVIENCRSFGNLETGFLIRHPDICSCMEEWPSCNTVRDCVSYCNRDALEHNADGFAAKVAAGDGNRFERCTAFLNSDDGFDLFSKNRRTGAVELVDCAAYFNGYKLDDHGCPVPTSGNGNGFKLGGSGMAVPHVALRCRAEWNKGSGFTSNSNPLMILRGCSAGHNKNNFRHYYYGANAVPVRITECCTESGPEDRGAGIGRAQCLKELTDRHMP